MPAKKRTRKSYKKRRVNRRYKRRSNLRTRTIVSYNPVPDRMFTKMRYSEILGWNLVTASATYNYMFQTSVYDPDLTATGHQPLWYDQYANLYQSYRVWGISYKMTFQLENSHTLTLAFITHQSTNTAESNFNTIMERERKKVIAINYDIATRPVRGYISVPKVYGMTNKEFVADDGFQSLIATNPAKMAYLVNYMTCKGSSNVTASQVVELVYHVEFFNRVQIGGS